MVVYLRSTSRRGQASAVNEEEATVGTLAGILGWFLPFASKLTVHRVKVVFGTCFRLSYYTCNNSGDIEICGLKLIPNRNFVRLLRDIRWERANQQAKVRK